MLEVGSTWIDNICSKGRYQTVQGLLLQHTPLVVEEGQELRFGASTRAFFLCQDATQTAAPNRKRNVQWPDESEGDSLNKAQVVQYMG